MKDVNTNFIVRILRKMSGPLDEHNSFDLILKEIKEPSSPFSYVSALRLVKEYAIENTNKTTAKVLLERMESYKIIQSDLRDHDISTYDGFMKAVEETMSEMVSGAAIGGAFDGAQSNADANSTGMAAPNGKAKKKRKGLENILKRTL